MEMRIRSAVAAVLLALAGAAPLAAQRVAGRLVAADGSTAVPAALVRLVAADSEVVAEAPSGADGGFVLAAPDTGSFRILAKPPGGSEVAFGPVPLAAGETRSVLLRLPRAGGEGAIALAPLTAVAEPQRAILDRHGFYQRRHTIPGRFLTHDDFARLGGSSLLDRIRAMGIFVQPHGADRFSLYRLSRGQQCYLAVYVDGAQTSNQTLTQLSVAQVAGVEYYTGAQLPFQFNPYFGRSDWDCGSVVIWTQPPEAAPPAPAGS
jgi:hypothetical protein